MSFVRGKSSLAPQGHTKLWCEDKSASLSRKKRDSPHRQESSKIVPFHGGIDKMGNICYNALSI